MRVLSKRDVECLIKGATILGTGGGGSPEVGLDLLLRDLEDGLKLTLIDPMEVPDDVLTVCAYLAGSIAPPSEEASERMNVMPRIKEDLVIAVVKALKKYLRQEIFAIVPVELGGANTPEAIHAAANLGVYTIDGDLCGRSLPEIVHSTYYINEVSITPLAVVDHFGNTLIIDKIVNDTYVDKIIRPVAMAAGGAVGVADHPVKGELMKRCIIRNTVSKCIKIGEALVRAGELGENLVSALIRATGGYLLFKGLVRSKEWKDEGGFMYGTTIIHGIDEFHEDEFKVWFKNENLIAWRNEKLAASAPDLICIVDPETGDGITNDRLNIGMKVSVIAIKSPDVWRTRRGLSVLSPKYFGFKENYIPIEELYGEGSCTGYML